MTQRNSSTRRIGGGLLLLTVLLAIGAAPASADTTYSIEPVKLRASTGLPESALVVLRPQGTRLIADSDGSKTAICEIFWAQQIATQDGTAAPKQLLYAGLKPGTLVGIVHFLVIQQYVRDFRPQTIKPGYYTMRYATVMGGMSGNEPRHSVALVPARNDRSVQPVMPIADLVRRSELAFHTKGPAVMSLVEVDTDMKDFPGVITDDEGTCVLQVKVHVKSVKNDGPQDLPLAIVLVTSIPEDSGS